MPYVGCGVNFAYLEYPSLRTFTLLPGVVKTDLVVHGYELYAKDAAELTGGLALYLAQDRADYLKGQLASVNWDYEHLEAFKEEIVEKKLLRIKWVSPLPCSGGNGL